MARKKEKISWFNLPGESHEEARVEEQCGGHTGGNHAGWFGIEVQSTSGDQTPIGCWSPKVYCFWSDW